MTKTNRGKIIKVVAALSLLSIIYLFFQSRSTQNQQEGRPQKPNITSFFSGKIPINMEFSQESFKFPRELPIMSLTRKALSRDDIVRFATNLGLTAEMSEFNDVNEGIKYFINTDKNFFVATPKTSLIKFGLSTNEIPVTTNKGITDNEFTRIATDFIVKNNFYTSDQIKTVGIRYFKESLSTEGLEETDRSSAQIFEVDFLFNSSDYDILSETSINKQIFVQILPDGTIFNSEILMIENIKKSVANYPLKSYDELVGSIGEAKLISVSGDYITPSDLSDTSIQSMVVQNIKIAYLLQSGKDGVLQPVYVLSGTVEIPESTANSATLLLPAYR